MFPSLSMIAREITGVRWSGPLFFGLRQPNQREGQTIHQRKRWAMSEALKRRMRCAVYLRKSTEGLDQEYNSIDAQRDAGRTYRQPTGQRLDSGGRRLR